MIPLRIMEREYFKTWDVPGYQEWASPTDGGYELHIIRQEPDNYLVVKAKLVMGEKGLPGFEVIEEHRLPNEQAASGKVQEWKDAIK